MYESIRNYLGIVVLGTGLYFSYKYLYPSVEETGQGDGPETL